MELGEALPGRRGVRSTGFSMADLGVAAAPLSGANRSQKSRVRWFLTVARLSSEAQALQLQEPDDR